MTQIDLSNSIAIYVVSGAEVCVCFFFFRKCTQVYFRLRDLLRILQGKEFQLP